MKRVARQFEAKGCTVIPAEAGIQAFGALLGPGLRRDDGVLNMGVAI
jgi:hypothetical protein